MAKHVTRECQICHKQKQTNQLLPAELVRSSIQELILQSHPEWSLSGFICLEDLNRFRSLHLQSLLESEKGELTHLEHDVLQSMRDQDILSENVEETYKERLSFGERLADHIALFGGSWSFLICFAVLIALWLVINTVVLITRPFDPYPFILLNLVLSCVAAVQAPVIMMSQNRQEEKDRLRALHDYRVNLKAELEIRQLHAKIDLLLTHQWQRLLEIQEMQVDLMQELSGRRR
jgi:uncharacterized membrane protein